MYSWVILQELTMNNFNIMRDNWFHLKYQRVIFVICEKEVDHMLCSSCEVIDISVEMWAIIYLPQKEHEQQATETIY